MSMSEVLVRIALVAILLLASAAACALVEAAAFTIEDRERRSLVLIFSSEEPVPRLAPLREPSMAPCFVACLKITASAAGAPTSL